MLTILGTLKSVAPGNPQDGSAGVGAAGWASGSFLFYPSFSCGVFSSALGRWRGGSGVPIERKGACAPLFLPPPVQRAPLWLSTHPSGIYKKCIPVNSAAGKMRWEDPKFKASMGASETLSQTN